MRTTPISFHYFCRPYPRPSVRTSTTAPQTTVHRNSLLKCHQSRTFINPSTIEGLFSNTTPLRQLTHTRVLPYPRSAVFDAIASVEKYPSFLPFVISADVFSRDQNNRPSRASLKVGYDALAIEEDWSSIVNCDEEQGVIEARSADATKDSGNGLFEVLKTKWQLQDIEDIRRQGIGLGIQTSVRLNVDVKFRSAMYDKLFAGVEEKVAGMMVGAFEKRIKELAGS
jgi:coenzyme Q-binding protein COQ10